MKVTKESLGEALHKFFKEKEPIFHGSVYIKNDCIVPPHNWTVVPIEEIVQGVMENLREVQNELV